MGRPLPAGILRTSSAYSLVALLMLAAPVFGQFKPVGPAPYPPAAAHQKIKELVDQVDSNNRQQTFQTISGLLVWYRDIADDEMIAGWKNNSRQSLAELIKPLADARVAWAVVEYSWRQQPQTAFKVAYAPMFVDMMIRFPDTGRMFLDDLVRPTDPGSVPPSAAEAACRILLDVPDIGSWKRSALQILPRYRSTTEALLAQDAASDDSEKRDRAKYWRADLGWDKPAFTGDSTARRRPAGAVSSDDPRPQLRRRAVDAVPAGPIDAGPPAITSSAPPIALPEPPASAVASSKQPAPAQPAPSTAREVPPPQSYHGPMSGTLECSGGPVAQNAEYVFRDLPALKMQLDYDSKVWDARFAPGPGDTQRLILKNKSSGPQKRCVVHWVAAP